MKYSLKTANVTILMVQPPGSRPSIAAVESSQGLQVAMESPTEPLIVTEDTTEQNTVLDETTSCQAEHSSPDINPVLRLDLDSSLSTDARDKSATWSCMMEAYTSSTTTLYDSFLLEQSTIDLDMETPASEVPIDEVDSILVETKPEMKKLLELEEALERVCIQSFNHFMTNVLLNYLFCSLIRREPE
jgi:hypothetical protein